jgi:hypothetical protein
MKIHFPKIKAFAENIALLILLFFGIFGAIVLGAVIHEYSHASDFKSIAENEKICGLVLPNKITSLFTNEIGYYSFFLKDSDNKDFQQIEKYTEFKAYGFSILILLIFVICLQIVFHSFLTETKKIKEMLTLKNKHSQFC